jgi:uncharacterized protein (DUF58 family)
LKQFEEETNLVCHLLLDVSESMLYKSDGASLSKIEYAQCAAAALAYLILHQQDSVGLATFDSEIRVLIRASSNPSHLKDMLHVLEEVAPQRKTAIAPIFHTLAKRIKKRGIVIVLSDLFDNVDEIMVGLQHLRHSRHEVIVMHVLDAAEMDFPFDELAMFRGLEQLPSVLADPGALRKSYLDEFGRYQRRLKAGCRRHGIDYVTLRTDQPLDTVLSTYLASRNHG